MGYSNSFFLYQFWFCMLCRLYIVNCFFPFRWKPDYLTALFTPHVVMVTIVSVFVFVIVAIGLSYYCYRVKPSHLWWKESWPDSFSCERRTRLLRRIRVQSTGMARRMDRFCLAFWRGCQWNLRRPSPHCPKKAVGTEEKDLSRYQCISQRFWTNKR